MLRRVSDDAWTTETRCAGWSVADLVAHTCWGTSFEADGLRRARTEAIGVAEGDEVGAERTPEVLRHHFAANADSLVGEMNAFLEAPYDRAVPMPYGALPIPLAFDVFAMEAGVHTSDLASALGEDDRLEPDVCRASLEFLHAFGPVMADPAARLEPGQSVGLRCGQGMVRFFHDGDGWHADRLAASTTITGDDSDVVLFALGRGPIAALIVEGDPEVAARFKDLIPGP